MNGAHDPSRLEFGELLATQPRNRRGSLAPGERFPTGMRSGRRRAQGVDLDSVGPYVSGDDLRFMDWRATARTGRAQMKRFVAESHLAQMLVIDLRAQMFFCTDNQPMAKTAALAAGRLAWEAFTLHEPIGMCVVPDAEVIEPRRGRAQVLRLFDCLVDAYAQQYQSRTMLDNSAVANAVASAAGHLSRGDVVSIVSDFGGSMGALVDIARGLADRRTLRAVIVEDVMFSRPIPPGRYPLKSVHRDERHAAVINSAMSAQQAGIVADFRNELRRTLSRAGLRATQVTGAQFLTGGGA